MSETHERLDVIIVGAGIAGLGAAQKLKQAGKRVVVLEARNRTGGRIYTRRDVADIPVELGGEFIHGTQAATWDIIKSRNIRTVELRPAEATKGPRFDFSGLPKPHLHENTQAYLARVHLDGKRMPPYLQFLNMDDEPLRRVDAQYFFACYSHQLAQGELYGERDFRIPDGYDQIPHILAEGVPLRLEAIVQEIDWSGDEARVSFLHNNKMESLRAKTVLITLPIGILRHGDVRFLPDLPSAKLEAIQNFGTVDVAKIIYIFDKPVLPKGVDQLQNFGNNPPMWWRGSAGRPDTTEDVVIAWTAGDNARMLLEQDYETTLSIGLQSLRTLLHEASLTPVTAIMHNWAGDPYTRGAYSFLLTGLEKAHAALAQPINGTLFWAGEATSNTNSSTVHGAYESGLRAADEILQQL